MQKLIKKRREYYNRWADIFSDDFKPISKISDIRSDRILLLESELFFIADTLFLEAFLLFSMLNIGRTRGWCRREGFLRQP